MFESGASHLLVTVKITGPQGIATRAMYHVPRIGDHVSFPADDNEPGEAFRVVMGAVRTVAWSDEAIYVDVTMGDELDAQARAVRGLS